MPDQPPADQEAKWAGEPLAGQKPAEIRLVRHARFGLGLLTRTAQIQALLDANSFWASGRNRRDLASMILGSSQVVTAWLQSGELVGFGRASSDGIYRAVLWDVVVDEGHQGRGIGRALVRELLASPRIAKVERVYLMTTNSSGFYERLGFKLTNSQKLLVMNRSKATSG